MREDEPEPLFIFCPSSEGLFLLNLFQIVRVGEITDDHVAVSTSDGANHHFHGTEFVKSLIQLLGKYSMAVDGRPLEDALAEYLPRLTLIKSKPSDSES
jgi:hypothetical protein